MLILDSVKTKDLEMQFVEAGTENIKLMTAAGGAVAKFIFEQYTNVEGKAVAVLCGGGNNGGDGFAAAKKLSELSYKARIILTHGYPTAPDAYDLLGRAERGGIKILDYTVEGDREEIIKTLNAADFIIDAVSGAGFHGEMESKLAGLIHTVNLLHGKKIAIDMPTGVDSDTGEADENSFCAEATVTFTSMKPGHIIFPGAGFCGNVFTANIGIDINSVSFDEAAMEAVDYHAVRLCFQPRKQNTSKGDYGKLLLVCGSVTMPGAAVLASRSACASGAGLVQVATAAQNIPIVAANNPDCTYVALNGTEELEKDSRRALKEAIKSADAIAVGCGLGQTPLSEEIVKMVLEFSEVPTVLDADALNIIAKSPEMLENVRAQLILTPHPGEMSRLTGIDTQDIQRSRLRIVREFAAEKKVYTVLKGANTIMVTPEGKVSVNLSGNPGMSKGGTGDVLTGLIGSLLAQGMTPEDAVECGVFIHSSCGDRAAKKFSMHAMTPMDIVYEYNSVFLEIER